MPSFAYNGFNTTNANNTTLSAFNTASDTWTETGITWSNEPAVSGSAVGTGVFTNTPNYVDIDLTSYIQSQLAGDKIVSIELKDVSNTGNFLSLNSSESSAYKPELIIVKNSLTLSAVADANTHQANPTTNYGTTDTVPVKTEIGTGTNNRRAFFKFDVAALDSVSSAKLRFYGYNKDDLTGVP